MNMQHDPQKVKSLAQQIWEDEGRPKGRHHAHWVEAERRLKVGTSSSTSEPATTESTEGLESDSGSEGQHQDTPGRAKSASSRQQTQPDQETQSGSEELDRDSASR